MNVFQSLWEIVKGKPKPKPTPIPPTPAPTPIPPGVRPALTADDWALVDSVASFIMNLPK